MFKRIQTDAPTIVAFDAIGTLTDDDYTGTLIPAFEAAIEAQGKVRAMIRFGPDFDGYSAGALMDDAVFGIRHLKDFDKIAVVTDIDWVAKGVSMFAHLSTIPIRVFGADQIDAGLVWLQSDNPGTK